jgi:hypothetical protein
MKRRTHTRGLGKIVLVLTVAAIAAPPAQAYYFTEAGTANNVPSNDPVWQTIVPSKAFPTLYELQQFRFTPSDAPAGPTVVAPDPTSGLPSMEELQKFRFTPNPAAEPVAQAPSGGIDWRDVGIGAAMAIGAVVLGAAAAHGLRRRRPAHS